MFLNSSKSNRCSQEHFKCEKCKFTLNADLNASRNIKDRLKLHKEETMKFDEKFNGYEGKVYIKKETYVNLVKLQNRSLTRVLDWCEI